MSTRGAFYWIPTNIEGLANVSEPVASPGRREEENLAPLPYFRVLGVRVHQAQIETAIEIMESWIRKRDRSHLVGVTGMHGVTEAQHDPEFKKLLNAADLVVPDGMPLVWLGRIHGYPLHRRVYGPELMMTFCETTVSKGYRHFFYGGKPGVPEKLVEVLLSKFPNLKTVGTYSPPFRGLTPAEDNEVVAMINATAPDIVWVGLSTPKQEKWMQAHSPQLNVPVLVGVGAAFDIHSGLKRQAPRWMREHGLEWLFRLAQEPRRLSRRYLIYGSEFLFWVMLELLHLRRFE